MIETTTLGAKTPDSRSYRIGLLGMYASANLGDTSIQMAVMQAMQDRIAGVRFFGFSWDPYDVAATHGISAFAASGDGSLVVPSASGEPDQVLPVPSRALNQRLVCSMPGLLRRTTRIGLVCRNLDALFVSGSGQIDDYWGGAFGTPLRLLIWATWAKIFRIPFVVVGVGLDELHTRWGEILTVRAMKMARFLYFRDAGTAEWCQKRAPQLKTSVAPDPAFALSSPIPISSNRPHSRHAVISPIARDAWPGEGGHVYEHYLECLAAVCDHLLERGLAIRFCCSQVVMDKPIIPLVRAKMANPEDERCSIELISTVAEYIAVTASSELVVASRLHGLILALGGGTPVIALSYSRKVRQMMHEMGLDAYCYDIPALSRPSVLSGVDVALREQGSLRDAIARNLVNNRIAIGSIYDKIAEGLFASPNRFKDPWLGDSGGHFSYATERASTLERSNL